MSEVLRAVLASLPLLGEALEIRSGFIHGVLGAVILSLAASGFLLFKPLLPRPVERVSFLLLLLALTVGMVLMIPSSFLLLASLLILAPPELFQKRRRSFSVLKQTAWLSILFFVFTAGQGVVSEILSRKGDFPFFRHPAGSYFLAGLILTFAPPSQRKKR